MIDLLIVLVFIAYAIISGIRSRSKASENLREYFLAGSTLKGWRAGVSMAATQFAADTPLLVTGLIATGGIFLVWRLWIYGIAFLLMGFLFSTKWRRSGVITDAELTEIRYSGNGVTTLRVLKAVYYGTVINCTVLAMVLVAAMRIAEVFLFWDQWLPDAVYMPVYNLVDSTGLALSSADGAQGIVNSANNLFSVIAILLFTTFYSTTGGLRSVVATDIFQFGFAMVGTLFYAGYLLAETGGLSNMVASVNEIYGNAKASTMMSFIPSWGEALLPFLVIISLQWLFQMNSDGTGYLAQRSIACKTDKDARVAAVTFTWLQIFLRSLIWLIIGVGLLVVYPFENAEAGQEGFAAAREMTFVTGINDHLPIGIKGIMLTGLLGALASTIDTHLNWGSSYWSNDIYADLVCRKILKREGKNTELVWVARISNVLIFTIALIIMLNLDSIQEAWTLSLLFGAGMGSVLVLRWIWERINLYSEIASIVVSLAAAPLILTLSDTDWVQLLAMSLISTAAAIIVTWFTPSTKNEKLEQFYERVKPQGFWSKTATRISQDPNVPKAKFVRSLRNTVVTAFSLYLLLVGFGKLLFYDGSDLWLSLLSIILGIGLIPVWWKSLR